MPVTSEEAIAKARAWKRARHKERMQSDDAYRAKRNAKKRERHKERKRTDPEYRAKQNAKKHERHRERIQSDEAYRDKHNAKIRQRERTKRDQRQFVGCDGEGIRTPDGRSHYAVFRMGDHELGPMAGDRRLLTPELLEHICNYPSPDDILIGFAFDYDVSNILYDVPWDKPEGINVSRLERVLRINEQEHPTRHHLSYTWLNFDGWQQFGVMYLPRNFLQVCRAMTVQDPVHGKIQKAIPGSVRTIYDAFGFFQSSFLAALKKWNVGTQRQREAIERMKAARSDFSGVSQEMRDYNALECVLLSDMMDKFRSATLAAGLRPRTWNGAGKIASYLHKENGTPKREYLELKLKPDLRRMAHAAYYGGRFEVTRIGLINETVWEHDIKSAYPAAMLHMPCLEHGSWRRASGKTLAAQDDKAIYVCDVSFEHPSNQHLCGLPFRTKQGSAGLRLIWPRSGSGTYWSCEIRSAIRLGASIEHGPGWLYKRRCDCKPLSWVEAIYAERLKLGADMGTPIKLGINSLYGKLAQRKGAATYQNPIWAGLITALTRSKLNNAIAQVGQHNVIMIATDAIYTVNQPAPLRLGEWLGEWDRQEYPNLFTVMPGLYWGPKRIKTRGVSPKFFEPLVPAFEEAWFDYMERLAIDRSTVIPPKPPSVAVKCPIFIGLRLAYRLNDRTKLCQWLDDYSKTFSFDWTGKRSGGILSRDGSSILTGSQAGDKNALSVVYTGKVKEGFEETSELDPSDFFGDMPDFVDLSIPFKS